MSTQPTKAQIKTALSQAGSAHHEYETNFLNGVRDEMWAGWYAAFVLGRLGDFAPPTALTQWLIDTSFDGDWFDNATEMIADHLNG